MQLVPNMLVSAVDVFLFYSVCCGLKGINTKISKKIFAFCLLYGIVIGPANMYLGESITQCITWVIYFMLVFFYFDNKLYKALVLYTTSLSIILMVQITVFLIISRFPINLDFLSLIGIVVCTSITLFVCNKFPLHKIFKIAETSKLIKSIVFLVSFLTFILLIIIEPSLEILIENTYFITFLIIIGLCGFSFALILIAHKLLYYTKKLPMIQHETKNTLAAVYLASFCTDDIDILRKDMKRYIDDLGLDVTSIPPSLPTDTNMILSFINYKELSYEGYKKIVFDTHISIIEPHQNISETSVISILAILLDNAMEASKSGKKIKIYVRIDRLSIFIKVENTYDEKKGNIVNNILNEGYSTKENSSDNRLHGYGLTKLRQLVEKYNGETLIKLGYLKEENSNLLTMIVQL